MRSVKEQPTYDEAVLGILNREFSCTDQKTIEHKIKRKLRRSKLGEYDEERIQRLRRLKEEVVAEIEKTKESDYTKIESEFTELRDFDLDRMTSDWTLRFPDVSSHDIHNFIAGAIYLYYLR